jgi:drug/metabolite transporter (DMT)-like permease
VLLPLGIFGAVGNQLLFVMGISRTSVAHAAIVIAMSPILVLAMASLIGQERVSKGKAAGMAIAFSGIIVLQLGRDPESHATLLGDALALLGAVAMAGFTVFGKSISRRHGGITVNTVAYVSGGLLFIPLLLSPGEHFQYASVTAQGWASLFYMAAFSSVISYLIFYHALQHISASRVSVFQYLQPILATLMAIPILREPVHPGLLLGGSLALLGVFVTEKS